MPGHEERELKFAPGPTFRLPDLTGVDADTTTRAAGTLHLHATYYDTRDFRLARAGASLRFRDDDGWTVKLPTTPGTVLTRQEIVLPGPEGAPPHEALDLVTAIARGAPIECVGRLNTVRERTLLQGPDGSQLAELVDDEVSVLEGAHLAARFRELEIEFRPGAPDSLVDELVTRLRKAGAGKPQSLPKIARALGPRAAEPPDLIPPEELDEASTPAEILRASIASSTARLVAHDPGVCVGDDAEDVHQARVATRRLRSDLRTFLPVADEDWAESLRDELKWLGGLLGAVRDTDVLLERLHRHLAELPDIDEPSGLRLLAGLHQHRDDARAELLEAMRSRRYTELLDRLFTAARRVPGPLDGSDVEVEAIDLVKRPWRKLRNGVRALGEDPPDPELHQTRIRAKRCRYALEAVAPALGRDARDMAKRVAKLQEILGDHQDAVIAGQWLRDHARDSGDPGAAFVAGELVGIEQRTAEESRALWRDAWEAIRHSDLVREL